MNDTFCVGHDEMGCIIEKREKQTDQEPVGVNCPNGHGPMQEKARHSFASGHGFTAALQCSACNANASMTMCDG